MAHIAKYKAPSCGRMLDHYTRNRESVLKRDNIDEERTHLNYTVGYYQKDGGTFIGAVRGQASWNTIKKRMESVSEATGRKVRKDAVVMADIVITAPQNVPQRDLERFFKLSYMYVGKLVGRKNMMGGYVHMDETTPHMHVPFTPIKDGRFNYKGLCPRSFYERFHRGLGDFLEKQMGYRPEIELGEERRAEKVLSSVPQADLDAAKSAILDPLEAERASLREECDRKAAELEAMKSEIASSQEQARAIESQIHDLRQEQGRESDRLESLQQRAEEVAGRAEELRAVVSDVRTFENASRFEKGEILDRISSRCDSIRGVIEERIGQLKAAAGRIRDRIEKLTGPQSLASAAEEARQASRETGRRGSAPSREENAWNMGR